MYKIGYVMTTGSLHNYSEIKISENLPYTFRLTLSPINYIPHKSIYDATNSVHKSLWSARYGVYYKPLVVYCDWKRFKAKTLFIAIPIYKRLY